MNDLLFDWPDEESARQANEEALNTAFTLAAAATQHGAQAAEEMLGFLLWQSIAVEDDMAAAFPGLILILKHMTWFAGRLAPSSDHPLGDGLRNYASREDVKIAGAVEMLERHLRDGVL